MRLSGLAGAMRPSCVRVLLCFGLPAIAGTVLAQVPGAFSRVASLTQPRVGEAATLLEDGRG